MNKSEIQKSDSAILIIEDDSMIRETLCDLLTLEGYKVAYEASATLALENLQNSPWPQLILLDLMMPQMSGIEFLEKLQLIYPDISSKVPIVIMSAAPKASINLDGITITNFLKKPFSISSLLEIVEKYCTIKN